MPAPEHEIWGGGGGQAVACWQQGKHLIRFGLYKEFRRGAWRKKRRLGTGAKGRNWVSMGQGHPSGLGI